MKNWFFSVTLWAALAPIAFSNGQSLVNAELRQAKIGGEFGLKVKANDAGIYHGAFINAYGSSGLKSTMQELLDAEESLGERIHWATISVEWTDAVSLPYQIVKGVYDSGRLPLLQIRPYLGEQNASPSANAGSALVDLISGKFDSQLIESFKLLSKTVGSDGNKVPVLISFAPNANVEWESWSGYGYGAGSTDQYGDSTYPDGPEIYRDAYRHLIDMARKAGADNVTWVMQYNAINFPAEAWNAKKNYYPGSDYIDWIAVNVWGAQSEDGIQWWESFSDILQSPVAGYESAYEELTAVDNKKPLALSGFASIEDPNQPNAKAEWIAEALQSIGSTFTAFKSVSYWNEGAWKNGLELSVQSSSGAQSAYKDNLAKLLSLVELNLNGKLYRNEVGADISIPEEDWYGPDFKLFAGIYSNQYGNSEVNVDAWGDQPVSKSVVTEGFFDTSADGYPYLRLSSRKAPKYRLGVGLIPQKNTAYLSFDDNPVAVDQRSRLHFQLKGGELGLPFSIEVLDQSWKPIAVQQFVFKSPGSASRGYTKYYIDLDGLKTVTAVAALKLSYLNKTAVNLEIDGIYIELK